MEYRTLTLTLLSATGLKKSKFTTKMDVYAVVFISGSKDQKQRTSSVKHGDAWNSPMKFAIDHEAKGLTLVVKVKAEGIFGGKNVGEVHVPVKELVEGHAKGNGKKKAVSYQVRRASGKPKGVLSFEYEFSGYPNQHPGHVYYPPPPRPVVQLRRCSSMPEIRI